ncbi:MAG: hypothetical protein PSX81_12285 [bacterium]|nr:hypothetical protein [bacterium]
MKNGYIKILMLFSLVIFLNNGCKPKDCNKDGSCAEEFYFAKFGEVKNYLWALDSSYWIYKNSKTGELDTQICIGFSYYTVKVRGTLNYSKYKVYEYDKISRTLYSTYYKTSIIDKTGDHFPDSRENSINDVILNRRIYGVGEVDVFLNPFELGLGLGDGSSYTKFIGLDSTLTVQGKTYYSVAKFDIDFDYTWDDINYTGGVYYWAKDVGIIKHTHKVGKYSWELTDYKIIK